MRLVRREHGFAANADARKRAKGKAKRAIVAEPDNFAGDLFPRPVRHDKTAANTHRMKRPGNLDRQPLNADNTPIMPDFGNTADFRQQCLHGAAAPELENLNGPRSGPPWKDHCREPFKTA